MEKTYLERYSGREDWLERRRAGIGGSDAAAIAGMNDYASPHTVWLDKMGLATEKEETEAMRQGTDLEEYVARRFSEETGKRVRRVNGIIHNPRYPFAFANIDRKVDGERAGLECKTTSTLNYRKFKDGEFPANYYIQCLHYLAVTGYDKWYLAVLVYGREFLVFEIERDEEAIEGLMKIEEEFWESVREGTPPPVDGTAPTDEALKALYSHPEDARADLFGLEGEAERLAELKEEKKALEGEIRGIEQAFKARLGNATTGEVDGWRVTWREQGKTRFDERAFRADHPEIDFTPYMRESRYRVFRMTEVGK